MQELLSARGGSFSSPATNLELFESVVNGLTADQVNAEVRKVYLGEHFRM